MAINEEIILRRQLFKQSMKDKWDHSQGAALATEAQTAQTAQTSVISTMTMVVTCSDYRHYQNVFVALRFKY